MVHQVPLHNKEMRHQTEHQILLLLLFIYFSLFLMVHQVLLHNIESQHQTKHQTFLQLFLYFNLFYLCIMCRFTTRSRGSRQGTRLLLLLSLLLLFIWIVHQVPLHDIQSRRHTGHQTLLFQLICFSLFEFCISCRSTAGSRSTRRDTELF